ncbi:MAG: OpgC domain-containing protein [Candidatus Sericytochromatia bacterium]|nr:OpgC domain-containing protein [Candidatus Sericytochromatia bacterium]
MLTKESLDQELIKQVIVSEISFDRDLRIDFLRGIVMFILIIVHSEFFSYYNYLVWERIGIISGGEGFVILSGFVIGMVYKKKIAKNGWKDICLKLFDRAFQLYRINIFIIISIGFISLLGIFNTQVVTSFVDHAANKTYSLYPAPNSSIYLMIKQLLFLQIGPHETQILGLYVFLLMLSPLSLFFMFNKRTSIILTLSWIAYFYNCVSPTNITGSQFENGFPLFTWQLIYFHGMAVGFHREKIKKMLNPVNKNRVLTISVFLFLCFFFFAQNTTNQLIPESFKLHIIPPSVFNSIYEQYFMKNTLGILRLLNYLVVLICAYQLLTVYWEKINKWSGWFFIPIGQASLYVFIVHVYIVMILSNFVDFQFSHDHMIINTLAHTLILFIIWLMVKNKVLFAWIPR